jgi:hypothetical protein
VTHNLALTNVVLQCLLIASTATAVWFATRRKFNRHCLLMRVSVGVQIVLIAALMAPSLSTYVSHWSGWSWFTLR